MKRYFWIAALLPGAALAAAALFANQVGLARESSWSTRRILVLAAGVLLIAVVVLWHYRGRFATFLGRYRVVRWLWGHRLGLLTILSVAFALAVYLFYISAGTWTNWPERTRDYDELGTAFRAVRLDLGIQPSAQLMALANP